MFCEKAISTKTDKNKEIKRFYYLDIEKCLVNSIDRIDAVISLPEDRTLRENFGRDTVLDVSSRDGEFKNHMFPLNIVYDRTATSKWRNEYQRYHGYDSAIVERFDIFDTEIPQAIYGYKVPVIKLNKETPKDAVCQVFENVNTGGVSLTVFDRPLDCNHFVKSLLHS